MTVGIGGSLYALQIAGDTDTGLTCGIAGIVRQDIAIARIPK